MNVHTQMRKIAIKCPYIGKLIQDKEFLKKQLQAEIDTKYSMEKELTYLNKKQSNGGASIAENKFSGAVKILSDEYGLKLSMDQNSCLDKEKMPIPWYTYPAIEYIKQLDFSDKTIFEFGLGNSTLYWMNRVRNIVSVDHDEEWINVINKKITDNVTILKRDLNESYYDAIFDYEKKFDVIIIDGQLREECCFNAIKKLSDNGMIILDNSERCLKYHDYARAIEALKQADLIQVDFCGFGPINNYAWATSFFFTRDFDFKSLNHPMQPVKIIGQI